jgi:hypothetical protein
MDRIQLSCSNRGAEKKCVNSLNCYHYNLHITQYSYCDNKNLYIYLFILVYYVQILIASLLSADSGRLEKARYNINKMLFRRYLLFSMRRTQALFILNFFQSANVSLDVQIRIQNPYSPFLYLLNRDPYLVNTDPLM